MREPYSEDVADHTGFESCAFHGNMLGEALTEVCAGVDIELRKFNHVSSADLFLLWGRQDHVCRYGEAYMDSAESKTHCMCRSTLRGNREALLLAWADRAWVCIENRGGVRQ